LEGVVVAGTILELVVVALKLVYTIVSSIIAWKLEERNRFEERMKTITKLLKEAVDNKEESLNEGDYLSNLEWEKQAKYKVYKQKSQDVLAVGGGINDLILVQNMGMGLRVTSKKEVIIQILLKNLEVEEKSKWIAKELLEV
jgi:hypothetical protein